MAIFLRNCFKCVIVVFLVTFFLVGIIYLFLNWPRFYQTIVPPVVESQYPDIQIDTFRAKKAKYKFPDQFKFENVELDLGIQDKRYQIKLISLNLNHVGRFLLKRGQADLTVSLSSFLTEDVNVNYSDLEFSFAYRKDQIVGFNSKVFVNYCKALDYQLNNAEITMSGDFNRFEVDLIKASFYGGNLTGQMSFENSVAFPYQVVLKFDHISTEHLNEIYKELYSNFRGLISGILKVAGNKQDIELINLDLNASSGVEFKAWFVGWLIDFIPGNEKLLSKEIKDVIKKNGLLTADSLTLAVRNTSDRTLQAGVSMKIRKYYLNPNYTYDINIDGRLLEALKRAELALKTGGFYGSR